MGGKQGVIILGSTLEAPRDYPLGYKVYSVNHLIMYLKEEVLRLSLQGEGEYNLEPTFNVIGQTPAGLVGYAERWGVEIKFGPIKTQRHMVNYGELAMVKTLWARGVYANNIRYNKSLIEGSVKPRSNPRISQEEGGPVNLSKYEGVKPPSPSNSSRKGNNPVNPHKQSPRGHGPKHPGDEGPRKLSTVPTQVEKKPKPRHEQKTPVPSPLSTQAMNQELEGDTLRNKRDKRKNPKSSKERA